MLNSTGGFTCIGYKKLKRPNNKKLTRRLKNYCKRLWQKASKDAEILRHYKTGTRFKITRSEFEQFNVPLIKQDNLGGFCILGKAALWFVMAFSVLLFTYGIGYGNVPLEFTLENNLYTLLINGHAIDTAIGFSNNDFQGTFKLKGNFNREGLNLEQASFSRIVEFPLSGNADFAWFGPSDNADVSKYDVSVMKTGDEIKLLLTAKDPSDKYRTILLSNGQEMMVYTNQNINTQTGLGEASDIASGWKVSFANVSESNGKVKFDLIVSKDYTAPNGGLIASDGGFEFPLGQLQIFGSYDLSTQKPMNYIEIFTKPSIKVNFGQRDKGNNIIFKDTTLKNVVIANITNKWKYPENETTWFASTSFSTNALKSNEVKGAIYCVGMPDVNYVPVSLQLVDSGGYYPKAGYYRTRADMAGAPVDIRIKGPPYDTTKGTMLFGSLNHAITTRRIFALMAGTSFQDFTDKNSIGKPAIGITFGMVRDANQPTLEKSDALLASDGFEIGDFYKEKGVYRVRASEPIKEADFGTNMRVKVIRNDSVVIYDTDVRAQEGATFQLELRTFAYAKQEPTGVEEHQAYYEQGFPNPTSGIFNIKFEGMGRQEFFNVYNNQGCIVKSFFTDHFNYGEQGWVRIDLSFFPKGVYHIRRRADSLKPLDIREKSFKVNLE